MYSIENKRFSATISQRGAELRSFKDKVHGREIMWSGDPSVWDGCAPILFPFVGTLPNGRTVINGEVYEMPMHGLVKARTAEVVEQDTDRVVFAFCSDDETLLQYPFSFVLQVEFKLEADGLVVRYRVCNPDSVEMLFSIGSHPALALDLDHAALEDYFIEFEKPETLDLYGMSNKQFVRKQVRYLEEESRIPLSETLFDDGFMLFTNIRSSMLRLKAKDTSHFLKVDWGGAPHLALWAKPGAAYICVEPWYSYDDLPGGDGTFEKRPGMMRLSGGDTFETGYSICVEDEMT